MMPKKYEQWLTVLLILLIAPMAAQELDLQDFNEKRFKINRTGMQVLGGWALTNMVVSGISILNTSGEQKAFHQMNVGWNVVNLTLAGFGYFNAINASADIGLSSTIQEHESMMRIFLFNAGLDVGYIMGGAYLIERAKSAKKSAMLRGFGKSVILQGSFLLLFDAAMYFILKNHGDDTLYQSLQNISLGPEGIGFSLQF